MEILWWLAPAAVATGAAMIYAGWVGSRRPVGRDRSEEATARMAAALQRPLPQTATRPLGQSRSNGVVVRQPRRSA